MDNLTFMGLLVSAIITLGAFIAVIMKFVQPINDLRILVQKLIDKLDNIEKTDKTRDDRLDKHDEEIGNLKTKVGNIETKVNMYHKS